MKEQREHIRFYQQKRILHKYVRWMYELLADGRMYELPTSKKIKDLPKSYSYEDVPRWRRSEGSPGQHLFYDGSTNENPLEKEVRFFERLYHCSDRLKGYFNKDTKEVKTTKVYNTCENRFCPVCQVRKAINEYSKLRYNLDTFGNKYEYFMLTLTLPNNKDGFKEELDLFKKCLRDLFDKFGFHSNQEGRVNLCEGVYGSYEITVSEEKGWHPHLHLILAYPKEYIKCYSDHPYYNGYKTTYYLDEFVASDGKKIIAFNYDKVVKVWVDLVRKYTHKYDKLLDKNEWLSVNFVRIRNIDDGINELAKYLIDFTQINSADQLYIFMRDAYGTRQRLRRGCFVWSPEVNEVYKEHIGKVRAEKNGYFIQLTK